MKTSASTIEQPITLVIPVYNEETRLDRNGMELMGYIDSAPGGSTIVFVDDGSTDATVPKATQLAGQSPRIQVHARPHLGKGAAVAYGLGIATTPLAGYTDIDLSTPLSEVNRLFVIAASTNSLVIGSRGLSTSRVEKHQSGLRERLGRTFNLLVRATIAPGVHDTQCGAKFGRTSSWRSILAKTSDNGFAWDAEAVAVAQRLGLGVEEVGIRWSHDPMTRVDVMGDGVRMALAVVGMGPRLRRLRRAQVDESVQNPVTSTPHV